MDVKSFEQLALPTIKTCTENFTKVIITMKGVFLGCCYKLCWFLKDQNISKTENIDHAYLTSYLQITPHGKTVVIVDEIGKMELFSQSFISAVRELFLSPQATILATVPITKQRPIPFVEELKNRQDVTLIEVRFTKRFL